MSVCLISCLAIDVATVVCFVDHCLDPYLDVGARSVVVVDRYVAHRIVVVVVRRVVRGSRSTPWR